MTCSKLINSLTHSLLRLFHYVILENHSLLLHVLQELLFLCLFLLSHLFPQILHTSLVSIRDVLFFTIQLGMYFLEESDLFLQLFLKFVYFREIGAFLSLELINLLFIFSL